MGKRTRAFKNPIQPYWTEECKRLSDELEKTNSFKPVNLTTLSNSWFCLGQVLSQTSAQKIAFRALENSIVRTRKVRIYPSSESIQLFKRYLGLSRWWYNRAIEHLKMPGSKASLYDLRKLQHEDVPGWAMDCPQRIREHALSDAADAVGAAKKKFLKDHQFQNVNFRKKRDVKQGFGFDKTSLHQNKLFQNKNYMVKFHASENYEHILKNATEGTRITRENDKWFLIIPHTVPVQTPDTQRHGIVALDPGVRTFISLFSDGFSAKIGTGDFARIYRLCIYQDKLASKISKSKGFQKLNQKRALRRLRWKVKDLISDLHKKCAHFLCSNFDTILLPTFETSEMVKKPNRKIRSKTARSMLTFAHYQFKQILKSKAEEMNCTVIDANEAYTSKTCSFCGRIQNIGSKKQMICTCGANIDRDLNGARGIYIRALAVSPFDFISKINAPVNVS